ncbi:carbon-nitrogen hydrolase family protein [Sphingomonas naphthae]|uniref:Carbon-nitrogen hydrolase family protein n=1 Tax=Sphingomonas naphthae TaxID=1813468 RepID=A0ABY7TJR9_9SPHN|nr:carbon-nitrogen hydrolase family protein [Sphingomonas naphthae]WCT72129.1 carbon-nitrogen hydrolase family protein [Sphingomonas naphthae]
MRIGVLQTRTGIDPAENAAALVAAIESASAGGADMLFTPEMSGLLDRDRKRAAPNLYAQADDPVLAAVRAAAAKAGLWVQLGSLAVREGDGGRMANRGYVIDDSGAIRAHYDKIHLFDVDLPSGESWRESAAYAGGDRAVVAETPWGRLGLSICYDLRFPLLFQALSNAGAAIIAIPAAFTVPTGRAHWSVLQRARAIESGAFVVAAAQAGVHADERETYGHSMVIDPWGQVLLEMDAEPGLAFCDIDLDQIAAVAARVPVVKHRKAIGPAEIAP